MHKRHTGVVVGKDFRPPDGARPLDWCYLTIDLSDEERIALALEYVDRWSLALDARILARTLPAVFSGEGAT